MEIYEYQGVPKAMELISPCTEEIVANFNLGLNFEIRSKIFDRLFKLKHVVETASDKQLNRECSLFTQDNRYVILGSASFIPDDLRPHFYALYTNNESITPTATCPLEEYTIYCIDLYEGRITDQIEFHVDKIILSHNQGLYLYNKTLAILSIQHQTVHLYHVSDGTFTHLRSIGRFCSEEEEFLYNRLIRSRGRGFRDPTINSLKHRILVFLFKEAQRRETNGDAAALRRFYQHFDSYNNLRMWKMQLLDENHILFKYAIEDVVTLKAPEPNSQVAFFVFYHIMDSKVLAIYNNKSEELLYLYENFCDAFRNVRSYPDMQCTSSPSNNLFTSLMHQRFKQTIMGAKGGGYPEATKRLLAQLPISAQSYSTSPYLDMTLFAFDDKWVSALERPKACSEYPIRFFGQDSGLLKFRLYTGNQTKIPQARRLVAFSFHPYDCFAISVQRVNTDYIANFHIRHANLHSNG